MSLRQKIGKATRTALNGLGIRTLRGVLNGIPLNVPTDVAPLVPGFLRKVDLVPSYESAYLNYCLGFLREGDVVIDVGAHIGLLSFLYAQKVTRAGLVQAVEPNPKSAELLRLLVAANGMSNIQLAQCAAGDNEGQVRLTLDDVMSTTVSNGDAGGQGTALVKMITVDTLVKALPRTPKVMKVDVEGFEMSVFAGARETLSQLDYLFCEIHPAKMKNATGHSAEELIGELASFGLRQDKSFYPLKHVLDPGRPYNVVFRRSRLQVV